MLAYELFLNNKDSTTNNPKKQLPIKKIFYKNGKITIDEKTLEQYGKKTTKDTKQLQDWLQMPLNTINTTRLNLPDFRTGAAGANPYVEIYGYLKTTAKESRLVLSIGKKPNLIEYILDLTTDEIKNTHTEKVTLKLDKKSYFIKSNTLFSEYIASGIIDENKILNIKIYDKIIREFLEFAKTFKSNITKIGETLFRIYILPDDSPIKFTKLTSQDDSIQIPFIDYFGNSVSEYASTPTKTAKFLSYDDKAFTINCMREKNFYENLGIGSNSLEKVCVDPSQTFTINRLYWTFTDISNPDFEFLETKQGILTQLYKNYHYLLSKGGQDRLNVSLKIICMQIIQAKQEILINENLTMDNSLGIQILNELSTISTQKI